MRLKMKYAAPLAVARSAMAGPPCPSEREAMRMEKNTCKRQQKKLTPSAASYTITIHTREITLQNPLGSC